MKVATSGLNELARLYSVETAYEGMGGTRHTADEEALRLVLRALGASIDSGGSVRPAVRARRAELADLVLQPVTVAWDGALPRLGVRLPHGDAVDAHLEIRLEDGERITHSCVAVPKRVRGRGGWQPTHTLALPPRLIHGYHRLQLETSVGTWDALVISAPRHAWSPAARAWGIFAPLYALRRNDDWGIGDYTTLQDTAEWVNSLGGDFVSTLPLLASFLDAPFDPSPYAPVSRLFWNETFVDVTRVPGFRDEGEDVRALRMEPLVDYRRTAAAKRRALEHALHNASDETRAELRHFATSYPRVEDYARFRAVCDRRREGWHTWPDRMRAGEIRTGDYAPEDFEYHLFAQWQAHEQLSEVRDAGTAQLYLDMPLGVHPDGYDAWRFRDLFAHGVSAGAPPDPLFTGGQNWGFRPVNPRALRGNAYAYLVEAVRHHLQQARMIRLDHVMSLHRLYWIPDNVDARRGVYVRYPEDELFAVFVLESMRHRAVIVGEDLGTVPPAVRRGMDRHRLRRMHVVQFEVAPGRDPVLPTPPEQVVASLNTHDMPTFAGFWTGRDIDDQLDLGLIDAVQHARAHQVRARLRLELSREAGGGGEIDPGLIRQRILERLSASDAEYVLVTLEDLWLEPEPQNVPGTSTERPNWQRRTRRTLEDITKDASIRRMLRSITERRNASRPEP